MRSRLLHAIRVTRVLIVYILLVSIAGGCLMGELPRNTDWRPGGSLEERVSEYKRVAWRAQHTRGGTKGLTALMLAAECGDDQAVALLLKQGDDASAVDGENYSVLEHAVHGRNVRIIERLLDYGAVVEREPVPQATALGKACNLGLRDVVLLLLHRGADVNRRDGCGLTPLMVATDPGIGRVLISRGADVNAATLDGGTSVLLMRGAGNLEYTRILVEAGADVNYVDRKGCSALDYAIDRYRVRIPTHGEQRFRRW